jgi:phosphoglycolate phosphatase-like HAD superfamily hydrolase
MVGDSQADSRAAKSVGTDFYGRGEQFKSSGYTWGEDLRNLVIYLTEKLV